MHTHGTTHIDALCHVFRDGAGDRVCEFMLVVAPLRIERGLGSPVNPVALV
jgi:kynurenine formamidase